MKKLFKPSVKETLYTFNLFQLSPEILTPPILGLCPSLFHMKITASVTNSLYQDCGLCYLQLPIFSYTYTLLFRLKTKSCCDCCFPQQIRHRPLFNDIYYKNILM